MADEIHERLTRWAEWLLRSNGSGLGYPRQCSYTRMMQRSTGEYLGPEVDTESGDTEKAVQSLPLDLKQAVQVYYLHGGTREHQARSLQCHVRTMERRVEQGRIKIRAWLDDEAQFRRRKKINKTA